MKLFLHTVVRGGISFCVDHKSFAVNKSSQSDFIAQKHLFSLSANFKSTGYRKTTEITARLQKQSW